MHRVQIIPAIVLMAFFLSALGSFLVYRFGAYFALVDNPNERSSHAIPTSRSGGIGIWLVFVLVGIFFTNYQILTILAGIIGLVGLIDDRFTIPPKIRLLLQLSISAIAVDLFIGLPTSVSAGVFFAFLMVFIVGTVNIFNFMDGINGIAGLTGFVGFGLIAFYSYFIARVSDIALMGIVLSVSCIGFLLFNFPKAKVFMGDVGSIFLGFVFASFVVELSMNISIFLCLIMFLSTFYADGLITIYYRWRRGENLMQAHRSHLYQYACNELQISHWKVSLSYALIQFIFGIIALLAYREGIKWQVALFGVFCVFSISAYQIVNNIEPRMAQ